MFRPMEHVPHILVVDDDREIRDLLARFLEEKHHMRVTAVRDAREARRAFANGHYQLVVLDLMLPGEGGLDFARWLRSQSDVPIVMLTAMGEETDRIIGLELGADDYVPKPFNPRELLARIRAVLRRAGDSGADHRPDASSRSLRFAGWTLEPATPPLAQSRRRRGGADRRRIRPAGGAGRSGQPRANAGHAARSAAWPAGRPVRPRDRRRHQPLRRKLEDDGRNAQLIKTVRGGGYVLAATVERV